MLGQPISEFQTLGARTDCECEQEQTGIMALQMRAIRSLKGDSDYTFMLPQRRLDATVLCLSWCFMVPALVILCGCGGDSSSTGVNPPPGGPPALAVSALVSGLASPT